MNIEQYITFRNFRTLITQQRERILELYVDERTDLLNLHYLFSNKYSAFFMRVIQGLVKEPVISVDTHALKSAVREKRSLSDSLKEVKVSACSPTILFDNTIINEWLEKEDCQQTKQELLAWDEEKKSEAVHQWLSENNMHDYYTFTTLVPLIRFLEKY